MIGRRGKQENREMDKEEGRSPFMKGKTIEGTTVETGTQGLGVRRKQAESQEDRLITNWMSWLKKPVREKERFLTC